MVDLDLFVSLLRYSLWNESIKERIGELTHEQYTLLSQLAKQQTVSGLVSQALIDNDIKLEEDDVLDVCSLVVSINRQNQKIDEAVVKLCKMMEEQSIRILVMKGQTLSIFYSTPDLRQSGDIDFICHPDDIDKAVQFLKKDLGLELSDHGSDKHARFTMDDVKYEVHRMLTNFAYPPSHHYWEKVYMKEVWEHPYTVGVNGYPVPTLAPTYNAVYVFEHILFHLIMDGVGLRQFCDWAVFLHQHKDTINKELLVKLLEGVRLKKAYSGLGAVLTDYLGLPENSFPLPISEKDHRKSESLFKNLIEWGNFGHNLQYKNSHGPLHGLEHLKRIGCQAWRFKSYAPAELLWRVPYMLKWWTKRGVRRFTPFCQSVFQK
ncbi:MAG: nucleotidyltransferase family protein [Prevotella sp.]|nr:nucleotidyltransferase family protein [Prevotella sp.]